MGGLSNGTTYNVSVRAVNAIGAGAASAPLAATPATVPGAPTIVGNTIAGSNSQLLGRLHRARQQRRRGHHEL